MDNKLPDGFAPIEEQEEYAPLYSDGALTLSFVAKHGDHLRYVSQWNKWFIWDGKRWAEDTKRAVLMVSLWIEECCDVEDKEAFTLSSALFTSWKGWAEQRNIPVGALRAFTDDLESRGFEGARSTDKMRLGGRKGIKIRHHARDGGIA